MELDEGEIRDWKLYSSPPFLIPLNTIEFERC
jgi:hypothetical protein